MASNLRIYIRSIQDKFMFFKFINDFCSYLKSNLNWGKENFFENKEVSDRLEIAKKEYESKKQNIFSELNYESEINFVK